MALSACKKEVDQLATGGTTTIEEDVTPRVQAFVFNARHNSGAREDSPLTSDSALWYVEAALNYSYTNISQNYSDAVVDTARFSVPITTDGSVLESDAINAFNALSIPINSSNVDGTSHVAIVDLDAVTAMDSLHYTAVYVVGSGYDRGTPNTTYGPNDYWRVGGSASNNYCGCGPNLNAYGSCSDKKIQERINFAINGGYYQYWTDVETWTVDPITTNIQARHVSSLDFPSPIGPDNLVQGDMVRDWLVLFYMGTSSFDCLNPTDMRFYTQGTWDVMQMIRSQWVSTKYPASCTVTGGAYLNFPSDFQAWHSAQFRYGKIAKSSH